MHLLLDVLRSGDCFIDVGANVGVYTLLAATIPGVDVWAFEPSSAAAERAIENIRRNRLEARCHLLKLAVGGAPGLGHVTVGLGTMNRTTTGAPETLGDTQVEEVEIVSLDTVIPPSVQQAVAAVKVDVEGDELLVLAGASNILLLSNSILIVEANDPPALRAFFTDKGYLPYIYDPRTRELLLKQHSDDPRANSVYIRDIDSIRQRLAISRARMP